MEKMSISYPALLILVAIIFTGGIGFGLLLREREIKEMTEILNELNTSITYASRYIEKLQSENRQLRSEIQTLQQRLEEEKFFFYYCSLSSQRYGVYDLADYLERWEWTEGAYTKDVFDCSEMAAYLEWRLENEGYHTIIVTGRAPFGGGKHAWLLVETSPNRWMPVEPTTYSIVWWDNPYFDNYFVYEHEFESIFEAINVFPDEFDWWEVLYGG